MKTLFKALGLALGVSLSAWAGPVTPTAGSFIVNVSSAPATQQFTVKSGTFTSQMNLPFITAGQCVTTDATGKVVGQSCSTGAGGGIVSPGTFTWTNAQGISASTATIGSPTGTTFGNAPYSVFSASGTSQAMQVNINGTPSGGAQNQIGGITINGPPNITDPNNSPALLVLSDSTTNVTNGSGLLEIWENNAAHDEYLLWIHGSSTRNSDEPIRFDGPTFGIDEVNTSTDTAHGLGKWKVISEAFHGVDSQIASSRAWDNTTFENVVMAHRLDATDFAPGIYLAAQNLADDSAVLSSSDTGAVGFTSLNNHTVSLTGPLSPTASYEFSLPSTVGAQGEVMFNNGNRGSNFHARSMEWTDPGSPGQVLALTAASTPTWTTLTAGAAGNTFDFQYKNVSAGASGTLGRVAFDTNNNDLYLGTTGQIEMGDVANDHFVAFKSSNVLVGSTVWTLPDLDGSTGQVLTTLGSSGGHNLTWTTPSAGGGVPAGANFSFQYNNSGAFGGNSDFIYDPTHHALEAQTTAQMQFYETANDHFVGFRAQNSGMVGSTTYQWPNADGSAGQVLSTTGGAGSDILQWVANGSGSGGSSVYPATAPASFPFSLTASSITVNPTLATGKTSPLVMNTTSYFVSAATATHTYVYGGFPNVTSSDDSALILWASTVTYENNFKTNNGGATGVFIENGAPGDVGIILRPGPTSGPQSIDFQVGSSTTPTMSLSANSVAISNPFSNPTSYASFAIQGSSADFTPVYAVLTSTNNMTLTAQWSLPRADGKANQAMVTNGTGNLSFASMPTVYPSTATASFPFGISGSVTVTSSVTAQGLKTTSGFVNSTINSKNASYVAVSTDSVILASATVASGITITLPASSASTGQGLTIEKVDQGTNTVTVLANGTDVIQGTGTVVLNAYTQTIGLIADGVNGWIPTINQPTPPMISNYVQASAVSVLASSQVYVQGVYVPVPVSVVGFNLGVGVQAGQMDFGLYNSKYQLVFDTGTMTVPSAGINQIKIKPLNLAPGWYYMALQGNNGVTASFQRAAGNSSNMNCEVSSGNTTFPLPSAPSSATFGSTALCFEEGLLISGGVIQ